MVGDERAWGRVATRLVLAVAVAALVVLGSAGPATAHASLVSTDPVEGQSYSTAPELVRATFTEPVSVEVGGLAVRDGSGRRVDDGPTLISEDGTTVSVALDDGLADGTYLATYRVLSADGHAVSGSWLFGIGPDPVDPSAISAPGSDTAWEVAGAVARSLTYLGALSAAGLAFFLAFLHDGGPGRSPAVRLVRAAAGVAVVGVVATVAVQAALLTGDGLGAATELDVVRSVLADRLGWSTLVLVVGLIGAWASCDVRTQVSSQVLALYGGLSVAASFALWGHDTEAAYRWLAVGSDAVHAAAAAVWLGGLVGVGIVLAQRDRRTPAATGEVLSRFSTAAAVAVVALAAAGLAMTYTEVGSLDDLVSSSYGRLVLVKVGLLVVVLALAAHNRFRLLPALAATAPAGARTGPGPALPDAPTVIDDGHRRRLLGRTVRAEAAVLAVVLGVTAVLVNVTPPRSQAGSRIVELRAPTETGEVELLVTPARAGRNQVHVQYTDEAGRAADVATTLSIDLSLPEAGIDPIREQVVKIAPGHFVLDGNDLALPGDWTVTLAVRTDDFTEERTSFTVPVAR